MTPEQARAARKYIPIVVAAPLFLQNLTATVLATALPTIAQALGSDALHLNLAITLYLLSVAVFLPLAGWMAERIGARRLFCLALIVFSVGSFAAACSQNLWQLASSRALQGVGGAMMLPVARLILLRNIPPEEMVKATIWYTVPPVIGSTLGPLIGGFVSSYLAWPWLFLINIPLALTACGLALKLLPKDQPASEKIPLDHVSYLLMAATLVALMSGLSGSGKGLLDTRWVMGLLIAGGLLGLAYLWHSKRVPHPVMDFSLLRFSSFKASIIGGFGIRIGQGASPFMLPLLFQLGFGLNPMATGVLMFVTAMGSLLTRPILKLGIERYGFKWILIRATLVTSACYVLYAFASPGISYWFLVPVLFISGSARGILLVAMNTLSYTEIPKPGMSYATALSTMAQQVANTMGVAMAVVLLNMAMDWRQALALTTRDFSPVFIFLSIINALALPYFYKLPLNAGQELLERPEVAP